MDRKKIPDHWLLGGAITMYTNNNRKETSMKSVYIQRRIMVIVAMVLMITAGVFTVRTVENFLSEPSFTCQPAEVQLGHQKIWNIADQYCSGNITDATSKIMEDNYINSRNLRILIPTTIIVIKGGN